MIEWVNSMSGEFLAYFQLSVLQNSLFLLLIFGLLWVFRKKSASLLSLIALIGVIKLLLPPMFDLPILSRQIEPSLLSFAMDSLPTLEVSRASSSSPSMQMFLFVGWLTVALALFLGPLLKTALLIRKFGSARPIAIAGYRSLDIPPNVSVVQSRFNHTPLVLGFVKQRIILPKHWDTWSTECKKVVLAHELAHIRHRDHWVRLLQLLARSLYFFNPLVYLVNLLLNRYREMACDDVAVSAVNISRIKYTKCLVGISETVMRQRSFATVPTFSAPKTSIKKRILYQLSNRDDSPASGRVNNRLVLIGLLLAAVPFSTRIDAAMTLPARPTGALNARLEDRAGGDHPLMRLADATVDSSRYCVQYDENGNKIDTTPKVDPIRLTRTLDRSLSPLKPVSQSLP